MQKIKLGDWVVEILVDEDSHLNIFAHNLIDEDIIKIDTEQGNTKEFNVRLTTAKIEGDYINGLRLF